MNIGNSWSQCTSTLKRRERRMDGQASQSGKIAWLPIPSCGGHLGSNLVNMRAQHVNRLIILRHSHSHWNYKSAGTTQTIWVHLLWASVSSSFQKANCLYSIGFEPYTLSHIWLNHFWGWAGSVTWWKSKWIVLEILGLVLFFIPVQARAYLGI